LQLRLLLLLSGQPLLDHCLAGREAARAAIFDLVGKVPLTAHGIGLSIGTEAPLDVEYLEAIAAVLDRLQAPAYSEHLAFTRVPGRELGNLLPLPKTEGVAASIIDKKCRNSPCSRVNCSSFSNCSTISPTSSPRFPMRSSPTSPLAG
jgi:hypothetical protein